MGLAVATLVVILLVLGVVAWLQIRGVRGEEERIRWEDRRAYVRVTPPSSMPVELQIIGSDFLELPEVRNISAGGLGICVPHGFAGVDTALEVDLILALPARGSIRTRGIIRHRHTGREASISFGVQFLDITAADRARIQDYVEEVIRLRSGASTRTEAAGPGPGQSSRTAA